MNWMHPRVAPVDLHLVAAPRPQLTTASTRTPEARRPAPDSLHSHRRSPIQRPRLKRYIHAKQLLSALFPEVPDPQEPLRDGADDESVLTRRRADAGGGGLLSKACCGRCRSDPVRRCGDRPSGVGRRSGASTLLWGRGACRLEGRHRRRPRGRWANGPATLACRLRPKRELGRGNVRHPVPPALIVAEEDARRPGTASVRPAHAKASSRRTSGRPAGQAPSRLGDGQPALSYSPNRWRPCRVEAGTRILVPVQRRRREVASGRGNALKTSAVQIVARGGLADAWLAPFTVCRRPRRAGMRRAVLRSSPAGRQTGTANRQ